MNKIREAAERMLTGGSTVDDDIEVARWVLKRLAANPPDDDGEREIDEAALLKLGFGYDQWNTFCYEQDGVRLTYIDGCLRIECGVREIKTNVRQLRNLLDALGVWKKHQ